MTHRNIFWNTPYTFSYKEKDVGTGYGYFGARYYNSVLNIWLSFDSMAENTPYATKSKMKYDKVFKSAIANVIITITSIPDISVPNPESSTDVELSNYKYTYAKKRTFLSYTSSPITFSRISTL